EEIPNIFWSDKMLQDAIKNKLVHAVNHAIKHDDQFKLMTLNTLTKCIDEFAFNPRFDLVSTIQWLAHSNDNGVHDSLIIKLFGKYLSNPGQPEMILCLTDHFTPVL